MPPRSNTPPDFVVRNSIVVLVIVAIIFLCMLLTVFKYNTDIGDAGYYIVAALVPVIFFFIRRKSNDTIIRINKSGIYSFESLVTDWAHFSSASTDQLPLKIGDPRDRVVLVVKFFNANKDGIYTRQIELPNTMNKSEEQILAAIETFRKLR